MTQQDQSLLAQTAAINPTQELKLSNECLHVLKQADIERNLYSVRFFYVTTPDLSLNSPLFATGELADTFADRIKAQHPNIEIWETTKYFRSENQGNRQELLARIVGLAGGCAMSLIAEKYQGYNNGLSSACANGGSQEVTTNLMLLEITDDARFILCFVVVYGGNSARQHMPIGGYFRTEIEAKHFQAQIKSNYPECQVARQGFYSVDEQEKPALFESPFWCGCVMAYIRPLANGNYRADVRLKGIAKNKTFASKSLAQAWADKTEHSIKTIPTMQQSQLLALTDADIEAMGGEELFKQLGVDLFELRNLAKLEAINALSKKELLQLSAQEIERMGGAELFIKAGKRIRYKTFREVCTEYLGRWNKKDYKGQMQRVEYWCKIFGDRIMTDIDIFDLREHIDEMVDDDQRATTINRKKAVLSSVYKLALSRGYIDANIVRNVVLDDDTKRRDRVLTEEERQRLLKACQESHWEKLYLLVLMAMTTGARRGELMGLRWCNIDFKSNTGFLGDTKNGTSRELLFAPVVVTELKRFQEVGNNLLFGSPQKPSQPFEFKKAWFGALRMAGISNKDSLNADGSVKLEKFTFHCLRHGFCSALSDSGKEINQIAKLAGHKSIQTTMRLFTKAVSKKRQIVEELAQAFRL